MTVCSTYVAVHNIEKHNMLQQHIDIHTTFDNGSICCPSISSQGEMCMQCLEADCNI